MPQYVINLSKLPWGRRIAVPKSKAIKRIAREFRRCTQNGQKKFAFAYRRRKHTSRRRNGIGAFRVKMKRDSADDRAG